jgi:hypothetical protein
MKIHGNSLQNKDKHHLYEIIDTEENDIFKYGISAETLNQDGTSPRAKQQETIFNLVVNKNRFTSQVLITEIAGRQKAKQLENEYITTYEKKNGCKPRGNLIGGEL